MENTNKRLRELKQGDTFFYFFEDDNAPQKYEIKEITILDKEIKRKYIGIEYTFGPNEVLIETTSKHLGENILIWFPTEALEYRTYESLGEDNYIIGTTEEPFKELVERWGCGSTNEIVDMTK